MSVVVLSSAILRLTIDLNLLDLRSFLDRIRRERKSDLVVVQRAVDPRYETTAILTKFEERQRSPIIYFQNVKDCRFPLVTNVCGSMGRLALALDCPLKLVGEQLLREATRKVHQMVGGDGSR